MPVTPHESVSDRRLRVFLCHSSGDKPVVRDLYGRLKTDGFAPWLDEEELLPGQDWREEIPKAVRASDAVVVCMSQKSVTREGFLQREIRVALDAEEEKPEGTIFIVPLRLEEVEVPSRLRQWQWADWFREGGYQRLVKALKVRADAVGVNVLSEAEEAGRKAEAELKAKEEEAGRLRAEAEERRRAHELADQDAYEREEKERLARGVAEAERRATQEAEQQRLTREKAEQERLARDKAEADHRAAEKAEAERKAREKAETESKARGARKATGLPPKSVHSGLWIGGGVLLVAVGVAGWYVTKGRAKVANPPEQAVEMRVSPASVTVRENAKDGLKYVSIPPGTFMMGCSPGDTECFNEEKPAHQVTLSKGFWMGQTEVTVGAYKRFTRAAGRQMPTAPNFNPGWADDAMPIVMVTWEDARDYCPWAGGRLPIEAEWEYAARGGSTESRYGNLDEIAWYSNNSGGHTHQVAQKRANGFGLFDVLGNVWEWVNDWYDENYYQNKNSSSQDPPGPANRQFRVLRGGSWGYGPVVVRVSFRNWSLPQFRNYDIGFRCVREADSP